MDPTVRSQHVPLKVAPRPSPELHSGGPLGRAGELSSLVLVLAPHRTHAPMHCCGSEGRALHAALLALVRAKDPSHANLLHGDSPHRPFTVGLSWMGGPDASASRPASMPSWVRFTSFDPALSRILDDLLPSELPLLRIRNREWKVVQLCRHQDEHSWAAQGAFSELYNNGLARASKATGAQEIALEFASPTAFQMRESRLNMPLPWPRLVFQSLSEKWNSASPIPLWLDWPQFDRTVTVSRHVLETAIVNFARYRQVGFVGTCCFLVSGFASRRLLAALHTLADFALFAGVGKKTTMGMGLVRRCS